MPRRSRGVPVAGTGHGSWDPKPGPNFSCLTLRKRVNQGVAPQIAMAMAVHLVKVSVRQHVWPDSQPRIAEAACDAGHLWQ